MTFTDFCENILIALYQDGHQSDEWLSLAELQGRYGLTADASWLSRAMKHLTSQRRIEGRELAGAPDTVMGRITGSGMAYIESKYGSKDGVGTIVNPVDKSTTLAPFLADRNVEGAIDSSSWTGIAVRRITEANAEGVRSAIREARGLIEGSSSNEQTSQALVLLKAAEDLTEAPEPPSDIIWQLIERAGAICGILGLFISIFMAALQ